MCVCVVTLSCTINRESESVLVKSDSSDVIILPDNTVSKQRGNVCFTETEGTE